MTWGQKLPAEVGGIISVLKVMMPMLRDRGDLLRAMQLGKSNRNSDSEPDFPALFMMLLCFTGSLFLRIYANEAML